MKVEKRTGHDEAEIHFYIHPSNRYPKRKTNAMEKVIREYSKEHITRSVGQRAEDLFSMGLMEKGFRL